MFSERQEHLENATKIRVTAKIWTTINRSKTQNQKQDFRNKLYIIKSNKIKKFKKIVHLGLKK